MGRGRYAMTNVTAVAMAAAAVLLAALGVAALAVSLFRTRRSRGPV
ncbi:hypothetical protein ACFFX1_41515 [Dactylosporangium sucinum]|nr:hypothetical protein [Dactylosporangium sucinum]